jgi:hypothetical protein
MNVPAEAVQAHFMFTRYFHTLCNAVILSFACTSVFNWKTGLKNIQENIQIQIKHIVVLFCRVLMMLVLLLL